MVLWAPRMSLDWAGSTESQVSMGTPGKALRLRQKAKGSLSQSRVTEAGGVEEGKQQPTGAPGVTAAPMAPGALAASS